MRQNLRRLPPDATTLQTSIRLLLRSWRTTKKAGWLSLGTWEYSRQIGVQCETFKLRFIEPVRIHIEFDELELRSGQENKKLELLDRE